MALFAAQADGGDLQEREGPDREEHRPDDVHGRMLLPIGAQRHQANVTLPDGTDDVVTSTAPAWRPVAALPS